MPRGARHAPRDVVAVRRCAASPSWQINFANRHNIQTVPGTRASPHHLRWLSEGAQEGAAHAVAIGKPRLPRDEINELVDVARMAPDYYATWVLDPDGHDVEVVNKTGQID